jgi:DNA-binding NtrC family response regulator
MFTLLTQELQAKRCVENGWNISTCLIGDSPVMMQLKALVCQVADSHATVLIIGESGTGKELVARALHYESCRSSGPFVAVNGAALSETLLESELFGHEKGAFTGAIMRHRGQFEVAHGGTIFLDEIGDMPMLTQARMLRVLQERSFQRLGGEEPLNVDVRVICASNHDLEAAVQNGTFRKDLFYRIYVFVIEVPPLRERKSDIALLARHFVEKLSALDARPAPQISPEALDLLYQYNWPGNVRELENAVERALIMCRDTEIRPAHLPPGLQLQQPSQPQQPVSLGKTRNLIEAVQTMERSIIIDTLQEYDWNKTRAARGLGITRRMLIYKMANLVIDRTPPDDGCGIFSNPESPDNRHLKTH